MTAILPPLGYLVSRYPAVSHTFILREIEQLRALGHSIFTASINPPDRALTAMDATERREAEQTYCVKADGASGALAALAYWVLHSPLRLLRTLRLGAGLGSGARGIAYAIEAVMVARWMRQKDLAHLHVHFGNVGATVGLLTKVLTGCHLSYTIHGPDEFDNVPGQHLTLKMHMADKVVCISQFARSQLMRISDPSDWSKLQVCRLGVDPDRFAFAERNSGGPVMRLLCVGRLTPAKCQVLVVQACAQLRDAGVAFSMTFVGEGPDRARVEAAIAENHLEALVTLTGALTQSGVRDALARADVFVLPSLAEGIPVVLMEAMASGVPCVSTPVNGIPELIEHGVGGLLATPGDVDSLATQLMRLAGDEPYRRRLAVAARAKVTGAFDLANNVRQLSAIFARFPAVPKPAGK
jgi:glycosyltransferase involved in cell wall biosynthesis